MKIILFRLSVASPIRSRAVQKVTMANSIVARL